MVKNPPANAGRHKRHGFNPWVGKILWEGKASHSSIPAWRIPGTEAPGGLQSVAAELAVTEVTVCKATRGLPRWRPWGLEPTLRGKAADGRRATEGGLT